MKFEVVSKYAEAGINLPQRSTTGSAGYDFEVAEDVIIPSYHKMVDMLKDIVSPFDNYEEYISLAKLDTVRYVVSNTTEAGIVYNEKDLFEEKLNVTFPAKLTQFLLTRYEHFNGAMDKGLVMLPVELIDDNGIELKRCVKKYIKLWNLSEGFEKWVDEACIFTSTLVDRIVTGYPFDEAEELWNTFGYRDEIMVTE